jgi:hypothetical protein
LNALAKLAIASSSAPWRRIFSSAALNLSSFMA